MSKKLVIAYSGGLDTSYCAVSLSKAGYEVHAISVNTGGFTEDEINNIESNAYKMGVSTYKNIDAITTNGIPIALLVASNSKVIPSSPNINS